MSRRFTTLRRRTDEGRTKSHAYRLGTSLVLVGGLATVVASFLPWLTVNFGIGPFNRNGFQSWNSAALNVDGVITAIFGMLTVAIALVRIGNWAGARLVERLPIATAGGVALLLSYQIPSLVSLAHRVSASYAGLSANVGYGIWIMAAATVCAVFGGFIVGERQCDVASATLALTGGGLIAASSVMPWFIVALGAGQVVRNGFQLGNDLSFSVDGMIVVVAGLTSMTVGVRQLRKSASATSWACLPIAAGLAALAVAADQLPSLESLGIHVEALYGGGSAGPGYGLDVLIAGAGLAIASGVLARGQTGKLWTDLIFVGGVLIGVASVLPWFTMVAGIVPNNFTGFELGHNGSWSMDGLIALIAASLIMASRVGVTRRVGSVTKWVWLSVLGLAGASALVAYRLPLLYLRAHQIITRPVIHAHARVSYGLWVFVAGEAVVVISLFWATRSDLGTWLRFRLVEKGNKNPLS